MTRSYNGTYRTLLALAVNLDIRRRLEEGAVDAHAAAAMHAVRFAAAILHRGFRGGCPSGVRDPAVCGCVMGRG
ncbi:hypothetical protein [Streptomyces camelliae]|uniref:Uncharacterized protein n=1 Tax=Streptomyces camelliae TaxID=3004093 RepID=A0ABY7NWU8_9ACTN|nr:hypothetical protein [Streptomyces sp. HUAS 2-6]WBO61573.1 hypothetical protein O1G22_01170 [Streptomyces sp. HUAS 2-6]